MALNLVRNSRVFFTTNVNATTGVVNDTGFTTTNTQEIQVLDGFTFGQNTNNDTVTISEAGGNPVRGQRSFNTSLAPVDFSFSTYLRPYNSGSEITAEESVLWNAMLGNTDIKKFGTIGGITSTGYVASTGVITFSLNGAVGTNLVVNDTVVLSGITVSAGDANTINAPAVVTAASSSSVSVTLVNIQPNPSTAVGTLTVPSTVTAYKSPWAPITSSQSAAFAAFSNLNQLQKFGLIFAVDNVIYVVDNCAMGQATIDFGLDAIATVQWTGQATVLRQSTAITLLSGTGLQVTGTTVTGIPSTANIYVGQSVTGVGGTAAIAANTTIATVLGPTSVVLSAAATTNGTLNSLKILTANAAGTIGAVTGTGPWTAPITALTSTANISVGDVITATGAAWGTNTTAVVSQVTSSTALVVTWTAISGQTPTAPTAGALTAVLTTVETLSGGSTLAAGAKNTAAGFITNKLSTVDFSTLNALGAAAAGSYTIALTGGSITINNNLSYITPANLGVVNVPAGYYTGTRAISGTMNAYLKTGAGVGGTGQILADMLAAASSAVEPMASLSIAIGGKSTSNNRVVFDMPAVTFSIPTVDVQQVISTAINFTAEGSIASATANANTFALDKVNDIAIRYYAP